MSINAFLLFLRFPFLLTYNEIGHAQFKGKISEANVLDSDILGFRNSHKERFHLFSHLSALTLEFFIFTPLQLREKLLKSWILMLRFLCWPSVTLHWNPTKLTTSPHQIEKCTEINASHKNYAIFFFFTSLILLRFCNMHPSSSSAVGK